MRKILLLSTFLLLGITYNSSAQNTCTYSVTKNDTKNGYLVFSDITFSCNGDRILDAASNIVINDLQGGEYDPTNPTVVQYALVFDEDISFNSITLNFKAGGTEAPVYIPDTVTVTTNNFSISPGTGGAGQLGKLKLLDVDGNLNVDNTLDLGDINVDITVGAGGGISAGTISGASDATLSCESGGGCLSGGCEDSTDNSADPTSNGTFCSTNGASNGVLPVKWEFVRAAYEGNLLNVEWATAQEENNERFTVELSRDGLSWQQVKEVAGAGTTYEQQHYQAGISISGFNYLRIKQTDYDGQFDYSAIVRIGGGTAIGQSTTLLDKIYPNPVQEELSLQLTASAHTPVRIQVMSVSGTLLMEYILDLQAGMQRHRLQLGQLTKGMYLLGIENLLTGVTEVKRFQKL